MDARFDFHGNDLGAKFLERVGRAGAVFAGATLPHATQELIKLRASQINGCGFCVDMHSKDALHAGETQQRLNLVAAWREATVFTEPERAALALTEEATRLGDDHRGVAEETWSRVRKHYDDDQITAIIATIAIINLYNRINVVCHTPAGSYVPGQFA